MWASLKTHGLDSHTWTFMPRISLFAGYFIEAGCTEANVFCTYTKSPDHKIRFTLIARGALCCTLHPTFPNIKPCSPFSTAAMRPVGAINMHNCMHRHVGERSTCRLVAVWSLVFLQSVKNFDAFNFLQLELSALYGLKAVDLTLGSHVRRLSHETDSTTNLHIPGTNPPWE